LVRTRVRDHSRSLPNVSGALNMSDALDMIIVYFWWADVKSGAHIWAVFLADWRA